MKIGSNEIMKAACVQAAAITLAATHQGREVDDAMIVAKAEKLYVLWLETERNQHTNDLSF
jgi:hypothetical protein